MGSEMTSVAVMLKLGVELPSDFTIISALRKRFRKSYHTSNGRHANKTALSVQIFGSMLDLLEPIFT